MTCAFSFLTWSPVCLSLHGSQCTSVQSQSDLSPGKSGAPQQGWPHCLPRPRQLPGAPHPHQNHCISAHLLRPSLMKPRVSKLWTWIVGQSSLTTPSIYVHMWSMAAFTWQWQSLIIVATSMAWPTSPTTFTVQSFAEKFADPCSRPSKTTQQVGDLGFSLSVLEFFF